MFRFFILDNGLEKLSGHHYNQALGLLRGAQQLGYQPLIYCTVAGGGVAEIQRIATPVFEKFLYRPYPFLQIDEHAHLFAKECDACLPALDSSDILFFPNVNFDEIRALPYFLAKRQFSGKVVLRLLYYPHEHETQYWDCLKHLSAFPNIKLVTSSLPYAKWLRDAGFVNTYIGGPPHNLPYQAISNSTPQYEFAYLGQAAKVKGFELLLNALLLGMQQGYAPKTLLHTKGYTLPAELVAHLKHVTVVSDAVSEEDFYAQLGASRCIVTYYHPANYRLQDSAIVTEALALERLVLCSPLAFIADTYGPDLFQLCCTPGQYDEQALLKKMQAMSALTATPDYVLAAQQTAKLLSSPSLFVAKVLSL